MSEKTLHLTIVTQERILLEKAVRSITLQTSEGEITVLPDHIPLFSKLGLGELVYRWDEHGAQNAEEFAISGGFLDVGPDGTVTVLADHAIRAGDINMLQVEEAMQRAEEAMTNKESDVQFRLAEASLKQALNELRVAQKRQGSTGTPRV